MKKLLALAVVVIMAAMMVVPSSAALEMENDKFESVFGELPDEYADAEKIALGSLWVEGATNARHSTRGEFDYIYLKEDGKGDFVVEFTAEEDGVYSFAVGLMGWKKGTPRSTDVIIDDGPRCYMCYDYADADQDTKHYFYGIEAVLEAGEHTVTFSLADDFDDETVKSLYIADLYYTWEPIPEEEAPVVEEAPAAAETATSTFDASIFALAAVVISGAGVVVSKKRK